MIPTGAIMRSSTRALLHKNEWKKNENGVAVFGVKAKAKPSNYIEHYISDSEDFRFLLWQEAEQIINKFGFSTAKLQLIFASHTMKQDSPWESIFSLKASDLIKELGWDKSHKLSKTEKLNEIAQLAYVLSCLTVKCVWIEGKHPKGKMNGITPIGRVWNVTVIPQGELNLEGKIEKPDEVYLMIQPGGWTQVFLNKAGARAKEALYQFGYLAKSVLEIDPYHDEVALRLAIFLTLDSRVHLNGTYRVETLLKEVLPQSAIDEACRDKRKGYELRQRWNKSLELLMNLKGQQWQIKFDDDSYPEWLRPLSKAEKPEGFKKEKIIDQLLKAKITILPPAPIPQLMEKLARRKPLKHLPTATKPKITGADIRKLREEKKISQIQLAAHLGYTKTWLCQIEKGRRQLIPKTAKELMSAIELIAKNNTP